MLTREATGHDPSAPSEDLGSGRGSDRLILEVVVPVYNEESSLESCIRRLEGHLESGFPYSYRITIAHNASTDATPAIAERLAAELPAVSCTHIPRKGRGGALRAVWGASEAEVLAYCDVDLSTDLAAMLPLVAPLISGHSDLAIGTRLGRGARVVRGPKREIVSRGYNLLLRGTLRTRFSDAQCGFKAVRAEAARRLLPLVQDTGWFFDTELLVLAERARLRIHEVPVDWVDDPDSRVDIIATAAADLAGIWRMVRGLATGALPVAEVRAQLGREPVPPVPGVPAALPRQLARFAAVGVACTVAQLVLFALLHTVLGTLVANAAALLITAVANTALNRRVTFGRRGRDRLAREQAQGLVVFLIALGLTSGSLTLLAAVSPTASQTAELAVIVVSNAVATVLRFVALRAWVFRPGPTTASAEGATS